MGHDAAMTRRIAAAALAAGLLITPLAGCSQNQNQNDQNQNQNDQNQNQNQNDQQQNQ
jgi:predicted histidine transporter YuiF (NhaC family)